jgi:ribokinase
VQLEIPIATALQAARLARQSGVMVVLDAAPAMSVPDELLTLADAVLANAEEAQALSGIEVDDKESALAAARAIRQRGARHVAVGAKGGRAVVSDTDERWLPDHPVTPLDTTGAGDACASGIAVGIREGFPFAKACELGHAAAALATTRLGALASLPTRQAVKKLLQW